VPRNRRWSVSDGRKLATGILAVLAFFIISASVGAQSWELAALGVAVLAAGVTLFVVSAMNSRTFAYIPGTAHVISSSPPPAAALQGRCEMQMVVHAPGMEDVAVKIRDAGVPVSKWPDRGATLPILVAIGDPRRVRVQWDNVRTHGEMADGRDEVFDGEVAIDEPYDLFDRFPPSVPPGADLYGDGNVVELDLIDPSGRLLEPEPPTIDADLAEGPGLAPEAEFSPDAELSPEVKLTPDAGFAAEDQAADDEDSVVSEAAGADAGTPAAAPAPAAAAAVPPRPRPRPSPRPSPRPRRPLESTEPPPPASGTDRGPGTGDGASVAVAAAPPPPPGSPPPAPPTPASSATAPTPPATGEGDANGERPTLRIQHLLPASPAVPAIPDPAPPGALPEEATGEISEAYLTVTPPPGQALRGGRVHGVGVTLFVSNLGRSVAFYRDLLGFQQVGTGPGSTVLESGDGRIVLRRVVDMAPVDRRLVYLLLEVPDVQAAYEDLRSRGVEFVHRPRAVSRYEQLELWSAAFRDPDGHGIALTRWAARR
jgi:resuscitation-promoting factor RpfA